MGVSFPLFAAGPDDVLPAVVIVWLAGSALGLLVVSLVHAGCLLLACAGGRLPGVGYGRALGTVLICNAAFYGFGTVMAVGLWTGLRDEGLGGPRVSYAFFFAPVNFVYLFVAAVLGHAAVFAQRLGGRGGPPVGYGRAAAVAVIYLGLCGLVSSVLWAAAQIVRATARV